MVAKSRNSPIHGTIVQETIPKPHRGEMPASGNPEQDKKEGEDSFSTEKTEKYFWSMSGRLHIEQKQYILDETTCTTPMEYVDVMSRTRTRNVDASEHTLNFYLYDERESGLRVADRNHS